MSETLIEMMKERLSEDGEISFVVRLGAGEVSDAFWEELARLSVLPLGDVGMLVAAGIEMEEWCKECSNCGGLSSFIGITDTETLYCEKCYYTLVRELQDAMKDLRDTDDELQSVTSELRYTMYELKDARERIRELERELEEAGERIAELEEELEKAEEELAELGGI